MLTEMTDLETDLYEWMPADLLLMHAASDWADELAQTSGRIHSPSAVGLARLPQAAEEEVVVAVPLL